MRPHAFLLGARLALATLALPLAGAETTQTTRDPTRRDTTLVSSRYTNGVPNPTPLIGGGSDSNILQIVSRILQSQHYSKRRFDNELSSNFFDRYLDQLDVFHIFLTQADVQEFEKYRFKLDELTMDRGDAGPARQIFSRFRERLAQQYDLVLDLLKNEKLEFTGSDRFAFDRKKLPRPATLADAKQLWRDRLRYEYLQEKLNKEKPEDIVKSLTKRYTRVLRAVNEYDNDDVLQIYLDSLAHVYDPHSDYMGKSETDNFSINMKLSLGIGARLLSDEGICKIDSLTPGSPAMMSGKLKAGDKIIAVAQSNQPPVDVIDMKLNRVVELIRGAKDTEVRLTIIPAAAADSSVRKIVSLIRAEIKLEDGAAKSRIIEMPDGKDDQGRDRTIRLGVIDLPSFYASFELEGRKGGETKSTTTDVAKLLKKLSMENVSGVILDLRRNGGGSLEEAINLTGLFIKEGPVVQVRSSNGRIDEDKDTDPTVFYDGPLVVLTSRFSASASEILAGALQDYGRALIVGDSSTHGKGTVQSLLQLAPIMRQNHLIGTNDPGTVKVTIRKFYRASGASTQLRGVTPDLVLPSINNLLEVGESSLDNALPWDTIQPAVYEQLNRVEPFLADLKQRSDKRLAADPDFSFVREEMERYQKQITDKSVSLNEAVRLKEKQEADDRAKARKKELAARPEPPEKIYDITLKLADEPGLPAPTLRTNTGASLGTTNSPPGDPGADGDEIPSKGLRSGKGAFTKAPAKTPEAGKDHGDEDLDEPADPDAPAVDITLDETRRILIDYIHLLDKAGGVAAARPGKPARGSANN